MAVDMDLIKKLRESSGAGFMDCKNALEEAGGDFDKAFTILREKGIAKAGKRAGRATGQGVVEAYLHSTSPDYPPQVGVLIEVDCETDFVAKGVEFRKLAKELALQVAGFEPRWVSRDDVPDEALVTEREVFATIAARVKRVHQMGVQVAVVVGGGNIFRGLAATERGFDRATGDYMGMLATVINALALQDALERTGIPARTMTAIQMPQVAEPYIRRRAVRHLEKGRVVILAAGTGNPYFTTDTTAALRAVEIEADVILKATKVDGVYTADPKRDPTATKFERLGYLEVLNRGIEVMDNTALTLCMDNDVPIVVFNLLTPGNIERVVMGEEIGTLVGASV